MTKNSKDLEEKDPWWRRVLYKILDAISSALP